jgi:Aspartyl protease
MSLTKCLAFACFAALTLNVVYAKPHCPGNVASLTLRNVQGSLIVVPVRINHTGPYDFIVDTGAQISSVDSSLASELHLKARGTTGVGGVATYARSAFAYLDLVEAGMHSVANALVAIHDLEELKSADPRIRGILGENFLEHFDLLIDNRQHILCLDDSKTLALAVKGEHVALAEPRGSQNDMPFMRPMMLSVRLSGADSVPVLLWLDSGSSAPVLYAAGPRLSKASTNRVSSLTRVVNGLEQTFAIISPQDIQVGPHALRHVSFAMPMNAVGNGPAPREDGLLPTIAFQRIFISSLSGYSVLELWEH